MRLLYITTVLILLFSCSSKQRTNLTTKQIDSLLSKNVEKRPVFKDSELTSYVKEYDTFVEEYLTAIKNDDDDKIEELQEQCKELVEKAKKVSKKLKTPAQQKTFQKWMNSQQEKINLLNN